ncbi:hypothetical protein CTI12_AA361970 [Artemisia annua]|uniref:Replication protein A 70 kDa DNA-binding subunit B n=1 Tax=Artemisia annua TaxID=35608 RepID=A0A2U1MNG2_ARTAN|nr:hypothetical protein CTI12_AA361970 [Artemisia annua]
MTMRQRLYQVVKWVSGNTLDCCFFDGWVDRFNSLAQQLDKMRNVVMILQIAKVKYFNDKPSISNGAFASKLYLNDNIPEINTFRKMYQEMDGYVEKNIILNVFSPSKKEITSDEFFENAQAECIVYAKIHKVHREHGWWYLACKKCGSIAKEPEDNGGSSSSKKKGKNKADDIFPEELAPIVRKKLLFRFLFSSYNINFNNHVYQVKMISQDEDMIKTFKHGFINEENDGETKTPITPAVTANKFNSIDNIPFNIEQTPEVVNQMEKNADGSSSSGKGKRDVINLDEPVEEDVAAKKMKNAATVEKANGNDAARRLSVHIISDDEVDVNISKTSNEFWLQDSHVIIISDDEVDFPQNNKPQRVTSDCTVVKNYDSNVVHPTKQNIIVSTNTLDDENLVDNLDVEWICINKECVFHHHKEDYDDENIQFHNPPKEIDSQVVDNIQFHNPPKEIDSQVVENIQFQIPPKEIATHNPNHPYKKDDNKVENHEKSEDRYVCHNGLWYKLKRRHVRNKDWNTMWEAITHADEMIQQLGDMGKKIGEGYMVDHNDVSDDE